MLPYKILLAYLAICSVMISKELVTSQLAIQNDFCGKFFINGHWVTEGNCTNKAGTIFNDIKAKVESRQNGNVQTLGTRSRKLNATLNVNACTKTVFTFKKTWHKDCVRYLGEVPKISAFTACAWISPTPGYPNVSGAFLNYCDNITTNCNTILARFLPASSVLEAYIQNVRFRWSNVLVTAKTHFCIVKSQGSGKVYYFINGTRSSDQSSNHEILAGGVLILGQDQDGKLIGGEPGKFDQFGDGFTGVIEHFHLWNYAIGRDKVLSHIDNPCFCSEDAIFSFNSTNSKVYGDVTANYSVKCP